MLPVPLHFLALVRLVHPTALVQSFQSPALVQFFRSLRCHLIILILCIRCRLIIPDLPLDYSSSSALVPLVQSSRRRSNIPCPLPSFDYFILPPLLSFDCSSLLAVARSFHARCSRLIIPVSPLSFSYSTASAIIQFFQSPDTSLF